MNHSPRLAIAGLLGALLAAPFAQAALAQGVAVSVLGRRTVRLVTHLDVDDEAVGYAATVLAGLLRGDDRG